MNDAPAIQISGSALTTSLGVDRETTWANVLAGKSGFGPMTAMESPLPSQKDGAQAVDLPSDYFPDLPREARYLRWTMAAAIADAGLSPADWPYEPSRCQIILGTTLHGMRAAGRYLRSNNFAELKSFNAGATLRLAAADLPFAGAGMTICSACSSSLGSIAMAVTLLQNGQADCVIAGGYDTISEYVYGGFNALRLVAEGPLRPFARDRRGMKLAEGYGLVVLERADDLQRRGRTPIAHILGWGESADAHHLTQPHPHGDGAARAIESALVRAGKTPQTIDLVAAHATGTPDNDAGEFAALGRVFGDDLPRVPVVGFKSHLGHTLGGAGAVELILSSLALRDQIIPACANVAADEIEFAGLNVSTGASRPGTIGATLNTSLGFGGANTCVVLGPATTGTTTNDFASTSQQTPTDLVAADPCTTDSAMPAVSLDNTMSGEPSTGIAVRASTTPTPAAESPAGELLAVAVADAPPVESQTVDSLGVAVAEAPPAIRPHSTARRSPVLAARSIAQRQMQPVLISGVGLIAPGIVGTEGLLHRLANPRPLSESLHVVSDADLDTLLNARRIRRMSQYVKLQLAAVALACKSAGLAADGDWRDRASAVLGTAHGGASYSWQYYEQIVREGVLGANPMLFAEGVPNAGAAHVSLMLGLKGACQSVIGTRTAGIDALALASARIAAGVWDCAIVGAGEEYCDLVRTAYQSCGLANAPAGERATDADRFLCGGAGVAIVLESTASLEARGGKALGRVIATAGARTSRSQMATAAAECLRAVGSPSEALITGSGSWLDGVELAAAEQAGVRTIGSAYGHVAESFSATPMIGLAAALASGRLPAWRSVDYTNAISRSLGSASVTTVGLLSTDPTGAIAAAHVSVGENQ